MSEGSTDAGPVRTLSAAGTSRAARRRASGIYGTIITATVLASAGGQLRTAALAIAVLFTLIVYWLAEQYAELLGEWCEHGRLPSWERIRTGLTCTWPMVSAAYLPVLALIVCRIVELSHTSAANVGLTVATILFLVHGWSAARAAELRGVTWVAVTLIAGAFGVLMVIFKNVVATRLH